MDSLQEKFQSILTSLISYPYNIVAVATVLGVGLYFVRQYIGGAVCKSKALLTGKTVIITGGNTGIGKETAVDLARRHARAILACRSVEKGERAAVEVRKRSGSDNAVFIQLDLASLASVRQFAARILEEEPRVDILINNAGVMACPYSKTEDGFEMHFGVNHLGHFLLTNLLLERIKESPSARIVNVSGDIYKFYSTKIKFDDLNFEKSYAPNQAYAHSKLANILFTRALAKRLERTSVVTCALHPGVIATELSRHIMGRIPIVAPLLSLFTRMVLKTPWQGAQTTIHCAVSEEMVGVSGEYFKDCKVEELSETASDDEAAERLWKVSAQMVGLGG